MGRGPCRAPTRFGACREFTEGGFCELHDGLSAAEHALQALGGATDDSLWSSPPDDSRVWPSVRSATPGVHDGGGDARAAFLHALARPGEWTVWPTRYESLGLAVKCVRVNYFRGAHPMPDVALASDGATFIRYSEEAN